jgi:hypothetical protein
VFYQHHKSFLDTITPSMVRVRTNLTQAAARNFTYTEKCSFVNFSSKCDLAAGHHRIQRRNKLLSYAADERYESEEDGADFFKHTGYVQGVVLHYLFVNVAHRSRYLLDKELKERTESILKGGDFRVFDARSSSRVGSSRFLPYVRAKRAQRRARKDHRARSVAHALGSRAPS